MKKEFIPYELALELKQLGFDEPCFGYYHEDMSISFTGIFGQNTNSFWLPSPNKIFSAPMYSQAFRWFRDEHKLYAGIEGSKKDRFKWVINTDSFLYIKPVNNYEIYEEAELACLKKLIETIR